MKKIVLLIAAIFSSSLFFSETAQIKNQIPAVNLQKEEAFKTGEILKYRIHYGFVNAGRATLEVKGTTLHNGHKVYHMIGKGRTTGMTDLFFSVRDQYETYIDPTLWTPRKFVRDVKEGGFEIKRNIEFSPEKSEAVDKLNKIDSTYVLPSGIQDIFSMFYLARSVQVEKWTKGDVFTFPVFLDHEVYPMQFEYLGEETIDSDIGDINCLAFRPSVQDGRVFKDKEGMILWVSNDKNRIPVRIESELSVGSIKVDLTDAKNLKHPLAKK